jgi:hypothetical protein
VDIDLRQDLYYLGIAIQGPATALGISPKSRGMLIFDFSGAVQE